MTNPTTPTEALTSLNSKNLFHLSLICFSISLVLFVSTYNMIMNNGGAAAIFRSQEFPSKPMDEECPTNERTSITDKSNTTNQENKNRHDELLIGYKILHHTLKKESQLKYLHWLRGATFRGPKGSLKAILTTIYQTSQTRLAELDRLFRNNEPVIRLRDAPQSSMGDSIQQDVEKASTGELVPLPSMPSGKASGKTSGKAMSSQLSNGASVDLQWEVRFFFIQAQATRMVVALSTSLQKFEENEERRQWLSKLAMEYEGIRESLVNNILMNMGDNSWSD